MSRSQPDTDSAPTPLNVSMTSAGVFKIPSNCAGRATRRHDLKSTNVRLDLKTCQELSEELFTTSKALQQRLADESRSKCKTDDSFGRNFHDESEVGASQIRSKDENASHSNSMSVDMNSSFVGDCSLISGLTDFSFASLLEDSYMDPKEESLRHQIIAYQSNKKPNQSISECFPIEQTSCYASLTPVVSNESGFNYINNRTRNPATIPQEIKISNIENYSNENSYRSEMVSRYPNYGYQRAYQRSNNTNVCNAFPNQYQSYGCQPNYAYRYPYNTMQGVHENNTRWNNSSHHNTSYPYFSLPTTQDNTYKFQDSARFRNHDKNSFLSQNSNRSTTLPQQTNANIIETSSFKKDKERFDLNCKTNELKEREQNAKVKQRSSGIMQTEKEDNQTKKKRHRFSYTKEQLEELERQFKVEPYPTRTPLQSISENLKIPMKHLIYWFQNRRMKEKKIKTVTEN